MDNKWLISLVVGLAVALTACPGNQNATDTKTGLPKDAPKKQTGPGDDDDRPVTMGSGSLDFTWDDSAGMSEPDDNTRIYAYSQVNTTRVNVVRYRLLNNGTALGQVVFRRQTGQPLMIDIKCGNGANPKQEVTIQTTAEEGGGGVRVAPNLTMTSVGGADAPFKMYEKLGMYLLKHPHKKIKTRTITFSGVVVDSSANAHGCALGTAPFVCTVNTNASDNDSRLRISVCRPVNGSCPQPAP